MSSGTRPYSLAQSGAGASEMTAAEFQAVFAAGGNNTHRQNNPLLQLQGKQNRQSGLYFEELLCAGCEHYEIMELAAVKKTPEPMSPIKRLENNRFIAVYTGKAQEDYKGTLAGGRSLAFEAKHTSKDRIAQQAVTAEQEKRLNLNERLGALCFVVVSIQARNFYRVPWAVFKTMKQQFGRKYMTKSELTPYAVPLAPCKMQKGGIVLGVHFLKGMETTKC